MAWMSHQHNAPKFKREEQKSCLAHINVAVSSKLGKCSDHPQVFFGVGVVIGMVGSKA